MRFQPGDARWLALAVALHALILAVPVAKVTPGAVREAARVAVQLVSGHGPEESRFEVSDTIEREPAEWPGRAYTADASSPPLPPETEHQPEPTAADEDPEPPEVNLARLMDSITSVSNYAPDAEHPGGETAQLGTPPAIEVPSNWREGTGARALSPIDNVFDAAVAPQGVEVVDRWLAADGAHQVVVETPAGLRMCGRAQQWDPTQPLVEYIMMFHVCGGDQRTNFKFTPRESASHHYIAPVAKDTTKP